MMLIWSCPNRFFWTSYWRLAKIIERYPFLRVDCYITEKQIYFGELTFYPGCGFEPITPDTDDVVWGEWLKLQKGTKK